MLIAVVVGKPLLRRATFFSSESMPECLMSSVNMHKTRRAAIPMNLGTGFLPAAPQHMYVFHGQY